MQKLKRSGGIGPKEYGHRYRHGIGIGRLRKGEVVNENVNIIADVVIYRDRSRDKGKTCSEE